MTITAVPCGFRDVNLYPGNEHSYGPNNRVTGADMFRVAMTVIVPAEASDARTEMERALPEDFHRPGQAYGLALLESQLLAVTMVVSAEEIEAFRTQNAMLPKVPLIGGWPGSDTGPWEQIIPVSPWHPGGVGILTEFVNETGPGTVSVFEYTVDRGQMYDSRRRPTGEIVHMVGWHCDRCHTPYENDSDGGMENRDGGDRAWMARKARAHARGQVGDCKPPNGEMERVVSQIASEMHGRKVELPARAAACAAEEGCARVRLAKATTARLVAAAQNSN